MRLDDRSRMTALLRWLPAAVIVATPLVWRTPWALLPGLVLGVLVHRVLLRWGGAPQMPARSLRSSPLDPALFSGYATDQDRYLEDTYREIGMGGPQTVTVMLADGTLVDEVAGEASLRAASDGLGPLRALLLGTSGAANVIVDLATHTRYDIPSGATGVGARDLHDRWARLDSQELAVELRSLMAQASAGAIHVAGVQVQSMHPLRGLWVDDETFAAASPQDVLDRQLPSGRRLHARVLVPSDLRAARNPSQWTCHPPYALRVDDELTPFHVLGLEEIAESPDGKTLVVRAVQLAGGGIVEGLYHLARIPVSQAGPWCTVVSHVQAQGQIWWLVDAVPADDGTVTFRLTSSEIVGPADRDIGRGDGERLSGAQPAGPTGRIERSMPQWVELRVDGFGASALRLPVDDDRIVVHLPAAIR